MAVSLSFFLNQSIAVDLLRITQLVWPLVFGQQENQNVLHLVEGSQEERQARERLFKSYMIYKNHLYEKHESITQIDKNLSVKYRWL